jgi:hypothetical protein
MIKQLILTLLLAFNTYSFSMIPDELFHLTEDFVGDLKDSIIVFDDGAPAFNRHEEPEDSSIVKKIANYAVKYPPYWGNVSLFYDGHNFLVVINNGAESISNKDIDDSLRLLKESPYALKKFQNHGFIRINQNPLGRFSLTTHVRYLPIVLH